MKSASAPVGGSLAPTNPALEVVGSVSDLHTLTQQIETLEPDVILLAHDAVNGALTAILPTLEDALPPPATVVLADDSADIWSADWLRVGIRGILPGDATANEIVAAIAAVAAGLTVLSSEERINPTLTVPLVIAILTWVEHILGRQSVGCSQGN